MSAILRYVAMLWLLVAVNITAQTTTTSSFVPHTNIQATPPLGFEVLSNRWRTMFGITNFGSTPAPNLLPPRQYAPPPPSSLPWLNTDLDTNFTVMETSNIVPHDAMEAWLLKEIDKDKLDLQNTNLDMHSRWRLEQSLRQFQGQWGEHETQVESNKAFAEAMRSNPRGALTNMPDPITQALSMNAARIESQLADPALDPYRRQALETILGTYKQQLADHETNAQLWAGVRLARASKDEEKISGAEHKLADYLAARIGKPKGMSLDEVMKEYKKKSGDYHWFNNRTMIRVVMLMILLVPPIIMLSMAIKKRISK